MQFEVKNVKEYAYFQLILSIVRFPVSMIDASDCSNKLDFYFRVAHAFSGHDYPSVS